VIPKHITKEAVSFHEKLEEIDYVLHRKIKHFFRLKHPKTILLILFFVLAYFIFTNDKVADIISVVSSQGYIGFFIAGLFFAFGFTAPLSAGFFIISNPSNPWIAAAGAMVCNILVFHFIKFSFKNEFNDLKKSKALIKIEKIIDSKLNHKIRLYLLYSIIGFLIMSPLPDEAAMILTAGIKKINVFFLAKFSLILHFIGILALLRI